MFARSRLCDPRVVMSLTDPKGRTSPCRVTEHVPRRHLPRQGASPYNPRAMFKHVPNLLTGSRLVLAVGFFIMLSFYQNQGRGDVPNRWLMHWAFLTYCVALFTDFLD